MYARGEGQLAAAAGDDAMDRLGTHDANSGRRVDRTDARTVVALDRYRQISAPSRSSSNCCRPIGEPPSRRGLALVSSL